MPDRLSWAAMPSIFPDVQAIGATAAGHSFIITESTAGVRLSVRGPVLSTDVRGSTDYGTVKRAKQAARAMLEKVQRAGGDDA